VPITISPSFKKRLERKDAALGGAILRCIAKLGENPHGRGLRVKKMQGTDVWEARVDQGNRLTFLWAGDEITLLNHCNHDILRRP
jgi:hypothetical protein